MKDKIVSYETSDSWTESQFLPVAIEKDKLYKTYVGEDYQSSR